MAKATLLSRIRRPELAAPQRATSESDLRDSVLANLARMCSTRLGTMLTCPDYGIGDISEMVHAVPDAVTTMALTLRHTIQTYEPRLQNVQVIHVPTDAPDLVLRFDVRARLVWEGSRRPVQFETTLDPSRRITIR